MSLLPQQILPETDPIGTVGPDGEVQIDHNWWLLLYNLCQQVLGIGGQPPANILPLLDTIQQDAVTAQTIGQQLYPITQAEIKAGVTPKNYSFDVFNVKRYGAAGDGVTDDRVAIETAWKVAVQNGGGRIVFPDGATYLVASRTSASPLSIPTQQNNGSIAYASSQCAMYLVGGTNIDFDFQGSNITTTLTEGDQFIVLDNSVNIRFLGAKFFGTQVPSTGVVALGTITSGSGYTNGVYENVPMTGGSGAGCSCAVTVSGGVVTAVSVLYPGGNYVVGDDLSCAAANIGGTGSGFSVPVASITGAGPVVATAAPNAIACIALTGSVEFINCHDLSAINMYTAFYATADPNGGNQVSHITLTGTTQAINCEYGVALHNTGDEAAIENLYTYRVSRPIFFYGVENVVAKQVTGEQVNYGFQPLVKAYSRSTRNINVRYVALNQQGQSDVTARFSFQVESGLSPLPFVENIYLEYDEQNVFTLGGYGIEFDLFNGSAVQQSTTTSLIFNNFILRGFTNQRLMTTVSLTSSSNQCKINYDDLIFTKPPAANDVSQNGFVSSNQFTYTPTVQFGGGAATGWTFATNAVEYYISAGICHVYGNLFNTLKGSATGALTISMPLPSRLVSSRPALFHGMVQSNGANLSGPVTGLITAGGGTTVASPAIQGAVSAPALNDTDLAAGFTLYYETHYPV